MRLQITEHYFHAKKNAAHFNVRHLSKQTLPAFKTLSKLLIADFSYQEYVYAFLLISFNCPFQTFLPCILLTKYIIPTKMKKKGPAKPNAATHFPP
jgi:hypothetical protein